MLEKWVLGAGSDCENGGWEIGPFGTFSSNRKFVEWRNVSAPKYWSIH